MKKNGNMIVRFITTLLLCHMIFISSINASLPDSQLEALLKITSSMGISWSPSPPNCGSISKKSVIVCDSTEANVIKLSLDPSDSQNTVPDVFDSLPALQSLTIYDGTHNLYNLPTITNHQTISTFQTIAGTINMTTDLTNMASLDTLQVFGAYNAVPLLRPASMVWFQYARAQSLRTVGRIQSDIFSPKLTYFHLQSYAPQGWYEPSNGILTAPIFSNCPNLNYFYLQSNNLTVDLTVMYRIPTALTSLSLYGISLANRTFPTIQEIDWARLSTLRINNLNMIGSVPVELYQSKSLSVLLLNGHPSLSLTLTDDIGKSQITYFSTENTNLTGTVPPNILDGKITSLYLRNTHLSGLLPSPFLCCAVQNLKQDGTPPTYLFDTDAFSNYNGTDYPRQCKPVISSILPNPMFVESKLTISGKDLGNVFLIQVQNSVGDIATVGCLNHESNYSTLICTNPNIQGSCNVTYRVINDQLPYPTTTYSFSYANPVITSVSKGITLGGPITITGTDLFGSLTEDSTWVNIYGSNCTNIKILEPFTSFVCYYPPGITSNVTISLENKGLFSDLTYSPKFFFRNPLIISASAVIPNQDSLITIEGMDLWNDTSIVKVMIDDGAIPCTVQQANHSFITCLISAMPESEGTKNIQVSVNGQLSQKLPLFSFIDEVVCPNNCGVTSQTNAASSLCSNGLGFCECPSSTFGPGCDSQSTAISPSFNNNSAIVQFESFNFYLVSVIENGAETFIPRDQWVSNITNSSASYYWSLGGKSIIVDVEFVTQHTIDTVGVSTFAIAANTYTYGVQYQSASPVNNLAFTVMLETTPEECDAIPVNYATTINSQGSLDAHWMSFTKGDVEFYARFPLVAVIDNEQGYIVNQPLISDTKSSSMLINIETNTPTITTSFFQFDMTLLEAKESRSYDSQGNCPVKSDKWKAIVGGVIGGVAGAVIAGVAAFIIFRQQRKINETKSLLDKKLKELNSGL